MKKQVSLTALALATALTATAAHAGGVTVAEKGDTKLKISGKAFLGFTQNDNNGTKTIGGNLDRFYMQAEYYTGIWKARFTTDIHHESSLGKQQNVYLKYAFLEGKFSEAATLRLGLSHTPWIDYEQHLWKHRFVSKVTSDYFKFDDSADNGIGLKGKFADGMVNYWVTATSGNGYGNAKKTGALDINSRISFAPMKGVDVSLQYRSGYKGNKTDSTVSVTDKETLTQLMASYGTKQFRAGFNTIKVTNLETITGDDRTANAVWGWAKFDGGFGAFARVEQMDWSNTSEKKAHQVFGVDYYAAHGVTLSLAYDSEKHTPATGAATTKKEIGLFTQIKF
jgi:hypothetical protein